MHTRHNRKLSKSLGTKVAGSAIMCSAQIGLDSRFFGREESHNGWSCNGKRRDDSLPDFNNRPKTRNPSPIYGKHSRISEPRL